MIEIWAAILLAGQTPSPLDIQEQRKAQVESCMSHGEQLVALLHALDQPENDSASAATARGIQENCSAAAVKLLEDEWSAPCGRLLSRHAEVASGLADIFEGRRPRDDVPGFIYPGWQGGGARCYQITQLEAD